MTVDAWITVAITLLVLVALARNVGSPDILFLMAVVVLAALNVISIKDAFSGFANSGVLMVGALFVVASALRETGVLDFVGHKFLGGAKTERQGLARLAAMVMPSSAFLNNTPIVAMLLPVVIDWCRKRRISPSKLLIPLSFLTVLGGVCTLLGTSTNLVVHGLMIEYAEKHNEKAFQGGMGLFEIGKVGLPCALAGLIYMATLGRRLLPERKELLEQLGEARREYLVEMLVQPGCRLIGQTVEAAGLRQLPGLFLIEIDRKGQIIAPVGPDEKFQPEDRLVFTGVVGTIVDLKRIPGLVPAADATYEVSPHRPRGRQLCEAVISSTSPLVGKNIRSADFRALYNSAVVAVHRNGSRVTNKVGDIVLRSGDTLLLQTGRHFARAYRNNPDFFLVSDVEDSRPLRHDRAWVAIGLFLALIVVMSTELIEPMLASFIAAALMIATRCISTSDARQAVEWQVLVTIAASFGIGTALEKSGAAGVITDAMVKMTQMFGPAWAPIATVAVLYAATTLLSELITNNAAAALAFPFCVAAANSLGIDPRPLAITVAVAASCAFATPIGYQTHMMVYGPGGYRFADFVRVGLPLDVLLWVVATAAIAIVF